MYSIYENFNRNCSRASKLIISYYCSYTYLEEVVGSVATDEIPESTGADTFLIRFTSDVDNRT